MKNRKLFVLLGLILVNQITPLAFAQNSAGAGNGGDECERRILSIRDNIASWINVGNYESLKLPKEVTTEIYKSQMLNVLGRAVVSCTKKPILLTKGKDTVEKTCINKTDSSGSLSITCNFDRFMNPVIDDESSTKGAIQYRLVHHEYAGLAKLENNLTAESRYFISNQISEKLVWETEQKLPIIKPEPVPPTSSPLNISYCILEGDVADDRLFKTSDPTELSNKFTVLINTRRLYTRKYSYPYCNIINFNSEFPAKFSESHYLILELKNGDVAFSNGNTMGLPISIKEGANFLPTEIASAYFTYRSKKKTFSFNGSPIDLTVTRINLGTDMEIKGFTVSKLSALQKTYVELSNGTVFNFEGAIANIHRDGSVTMENVSISELKRNGDLKPTGKTVIVEFNSDLEMATPNLN